MPVYLLILAAAILIPLTAYAVYLLLKLKQQNQAKLQTEQVRQADAQAKRQQVIEDIRYIAAAMLEDRCELSEGVMRIGKLLEILSLSERVSSDYPALFLHYQRISSHPIMDARKALEKQARMKLDLQRMKSEVELEDAILAEADKLKTLSWPASH
ncbi:DUF2489 domain-containing protein [Shewanella sp. SR44-3]|uniref:DUF2489 domain-containing protein n=1 Tax=Shewanella sp. SR44-3 TaxID=2760936 RepID=UPI0015FB7C72|nr:DUF2489 domain-containing protein [Shewanella sp. SR44-3]MBB1268410.1 DUF2489 domain-containing protein [Shewanella sp. SR44-3]